MRVPPQRSSCIADGTSKSNKIPLWHQNSCDHATSAIQKRQKKKEQELPSLRKAEMRPFHLPFRSVSTVWLSTSTVPGESRTSICPPFLPLFPPFFIREGEIVKWPSQSNPPPRIAVSKQLRIPSFWKESAGDFLNFSRSEEISAWKLLKWLLCLISIPISTSASLPFPFFLSSLVIFLSLHYLFIFGKDRDLRRQKFSQELLDKD